MTLGEIVKLVHALDGEKKRAKDAKAELNRAILEAVVQCGVPQKEALLIDRRAFLDGYITGCGHAPSRRDVGGAG